MLVKILPKVAKKTRRLIGFRNFSLSRKVTITKAAPMREKTEAILSVTMISCSCVALRDVILGLSKRFRNCGNETVLLKRAARESRFGFQVPTIFITHNISFRAGNPWQVSVSDHCVNRCRPIWQPSASVRESQPPVL